MNERQRFLDHLTDLAFGLLFLGGLLQYAVFWTRESKRFFFGSPVGTAIWGLTLVPMMVGLGLVFMLAEVDRRHPQV